MMVIGTENVKPALRGTLSLWTIEITSGVYLGNANVKIRDMLWAHVEAKLGEGHAFMAWSANNEAGFDFKTIGCSSRERLDFHGLKLINFLRKIE